MIFIAKISEEIEKESQHRCEQISRSRIAVGKNEIAVSVVLALNSSIVVNKQASLVLQVVNFSVNTESQGIIGESIIIIVVWSSVIPSSE